jgi:hypothetical protein
MRRPRLRVVVHFDIHESELLGSRRRSEVFKQYPRTAARGRYWSERFTRNVECRRRSLTNRRDGAMHHGPQNELRFGPLCAE